jgi:hypothetical protein
MRPQEGDLMNAMKSGASALALVSCLIVPAAKKARRRFSPDVGLGKRVSALPIPNGRIRPQRSGGPIMPETHFGPESTSGDSVVTAVDEEIRLETLRQLDSIDSDDDDWRIKPLPTFEVDAGSLDDPVLSDPIVDDPSSRN